MHATSLEVVVQVGKPTNVRAHQSKLLKKALIQCDPTSNFAKYFVRTAPVRAVLAIFISDIA
jgi:hypothetical protein